MLGLTWLLIASTLWESQAALEKHTYKTWKGYKLLDGTRIKDISLINMSIARCASLCTGDCESATFSRTLNQCVTFKDRVYDSSIKRISDAQWYTIYKNEPVQFGNWTLVFKAQSDINQSLYESWTSTGTSDDNPLSADFPVQCLQLTYSNTCRRHFRSFILDQWVNIDKVKFELYTNGVVVSWILFDGRNSTWTSWFAMSKIVSSSWDLMKLNLLISEFSIIGFDDWKSNRRFSISGSHNGCHRDTTYFFAIDKLTDSCADSWPMSIRSFPNFIYSSLESMALLPTQLGVYYRYADAMAIFVTFID